MKIILYLLLFSFYSSSIIAHNAKLLSKEPLIFKTKIEKTHKIVLNLFPMEYEYKHQPYFNWTSIPYYSVKTGNIILGPKLASVSFTIPVKISKKSDWKFEKDKIDIVIDNKQANFSIESCRAFPENGETINNKDGFIYMGVEFFIHAKNTKNFILGDQAGFRAGFCLPYRINPKTGFGERAKDKNGNIYSYANNLSFEIHKPFVLGESGYWRDKQYIVYATSEFK